MLSLLALTLATSTPAPAGTCISDLDGDGICDEVDPVCDNVDVDLGSAVGTTVYTGSSCGSDDDFDGNNVLETCTFNDPIPDVTALWTAPYAGTYTIRFLNDSLQPSFNLRSADDCGYTSLYCSTSQSRGADPSRDWTFAAGESILLAFGSMFFANECGDLSIDITCTNGDADGDGACDPIDGCVGVGIEPDADGDGICGEFDLCLGDDTTGDTDGDLVCDDLDACDGDDATGDTDGDLVCDDLDPCPLDNPDDVDGDGWCDSDFTLATTEIVPGQPMTLTARNAPASARVFFAVSVATPAPGRCGASATGQTICMDLDPLVALGGDRADASGTAELTVTVPPSASPGMPLYFQAVTLEGDGATTPVLSSSVAAP